MTSREIIRKLESAGFTLYRKGARHYLYIHAPTGRIVPIPEGRTSNNPRAASSLRALIRRVERGTPVVAGRYV